MDDVLAYDPDMKGHKDHGRQILRWCAEKGIMLNENKFEFGKTSIIFAGYEISKHEYSIAPKITRAIAKFPEPKIRTELRGFIGLANQLSNTSDKITRAITALRPLLYCRWKLNFFGSRVWDRQTDPRFPPVHYILRPEEADEMQAELASDSCCSSSSPTEAGRRFKPDHDVWPTWKRDTWSSSWRCWPSRSRLRKLRCSWPERKRNSSWTTHRLCQSSTVIDWMRSKKELAETNISFGHTHDIIFGHGLFYTDQTSISATDIPFIAVYRYSSSGLTWKLTLLVPGGRIGPQPLKP